MAIVVEEERKNGVGIARVLGWGAILVILGAATYYVFFAEPELVIISPPEGFQTINPIATISIQPETVLNGPAFRSLKPPAFALPTPEGPSAVGRSNPFLMP